MPEPRVAHALFCDHLRTEANERVSFIGIHSGDLVVRASRRGTEGRFTVVTWLICDADDVPSRIKLRVIGPPNRRLLNTSTFEPQAPPRRPDSTKAFFQFAIEDVALPIIQEGDIEVVIETETGALRAGRMRLRLERDDIVLPPR